jgi:hypothetical protein
VATILLVVGNAGSLTFWDTAFRGRIEAAGHTVTVIDDNTAEPASNTYDGVAVSDSSAGGSVAYGTVAKPGLTSEQPTSWNLGTNVAGTTATQWSVNAVSPQNGGLTGTQTVYSGSGLSQQGLSTSSIGAGTVVATQQGASTKAVYVTWETGDALNSGTAPAKRCFLRIPNHTSSFLTTAGTTLLDAAIAWTFTAPATDVNAGNAAATPAAQAPSAGVKANAVEATASAPAQNPTVATGTMVAAAEAAASAAAQDAAVTISAAVSAITATATAAAQNPTADAGALPAPGEFMNFGTAAGKLHYAFDIGEAGEAARVLYSVADIVGGLDIDPEFTVISDAGVQWLQTAARADAPTTSGSNNARSEGRERQEGADSNLAFTPQDGNTHWQRFRCRIMEHPTVNSAGIATGQLHSLADDTVMVRTRYYTSDNTNRLVLKVYDPGTGDTVDVAVLDADYTFGDVYDILIMVHGAYCYVFYQDFTKYIYRFPTSLLPDTDTYMLKWGNYNQFYEGTSGVNAADWGRSHYRNVAHYHTGWGEPENYFGVPEVDPGAAASATVDAAFTRTATETGTGITARKWSILDGPIGAGTDIGTAAALSWTPTVAGTYTLIYGAKNDQGWSNPAFLDVTVSPAGGGGPASVRNTVTGATNTATLTHAVAQATRQVGDALVVGFANDEASAATTAAPDAASIARGWSTLGSTEQGASTNHRLSVFYKAAAEGGTADDLTVELASAQEATWVAMSITGSGGTPSIVGDDGGSSTSALVAAHPSLTAGEWLSLIFLGTDASTTTAQDPTAPANWTRVALQNPTVTSSAATAAFTRTMPTGTTSITPGAITILAEQWVTFHLAIPPGAAPDPPTVGAGTDATINLGDTFSRTATEDDGGGTITSREWAILSGPAGAGSTIGTAAALSWTPGTGGTYVLRYTAINSQGAGSDDVTVTVVAPAPPTVNAGADALIGIGQTFTRTATESGNPAVSSRGWEVLSGPGQVGSLSTTTAASFTPALAGVYTLRFSATNSEGTTTDDLALTVLAQPAVTNPPVTPYTPTRLYAANTTPDPTMPALTWRGPFTGGATTVETLSPTLGGTAGGSGASIGTSTTSRHTCLRIFVTPPLTSGGLLGGWVIRNARAREADPNVNGFFEEYIYVTQGSADTVRGVLLGANADDIELQSDGSYGRRIEKFTLTPVTVQAGDRIVIEVGLSLVNPAVAATSNAYVYRSNVETDTTYYDFSHLDGLAVIPFAGWPPRVNAGLDGEGEANAAFTRTAREYPS